MKAIISQSALSTTTLHRDEHDESGLYKIHTVERDDSILHQNERIRLEGLIQPGSGSPLVDGEVRYAFSVPPAMGAFFMRDNPDIQDGLQSKDEATRMKAAQRMAILKPEWCLVASNR